MRRKWRSSKPKEEKSFVANERIRAFELFVIDENGEKIGVVPTREALTMAQEAGMDLVEVDPSAKPPIAKIMDYGQFKYEREKKAQKQKSLQKKVETKGIRLSVRISAHDMQLRQEQAVKFLAKGDKLKIELILKGRERQHPEKAEELMNNFAAGLETREDMKITREQNLTKQGGRYTIILVNKK